MPATKSSSPRSQRMHLTPQMAVTEFKHGLITFLEPQQIPRGAAADSLNWITQGSKIEIRHGYLLFGTRQTGSGKVNGIFTAHKWDGTEVLFRARGTKLEYYNTSLTPNNWTEVGTNILKNEDVSIDEYFSPAGAQVWVSSPNSDLIKIMTANPGSYVSQYNVAKNFKGYLKIGTNRMFMWNYIAGLTQTTKNTLQLSYVDAQNYTTTTDEVIGTGDGATKTFTNTLTQVTGKKTCFAIASGTGNPETWTDNYLGVLTGSLGGTGTINYATGAISLTFNTAPTNGTQIKMTYQTEDSTNNGIADFTHSSPRTSGQGDFFIQQSGGAIMYPHNYNSVEYVLHERNAWSVSISADDTQATNLIFRKNLYSQYWRASVATSDGIYYIDTTDKSKAFFAVLEYSAISQQVLPTDLSSEKLDLSNYLFDLAVMCQWERYIVCACRTSGSSVNNRIIIYNRILGCFDIVDFYASSLCVYAGSLMAGDSATNNVFQLFSGFDDDTAIPYTYWTGNIDNYGFTGLKKTKQIWIEGEIDPNQTLQVWMSMDRGQFILVGTITGNGTYVDQGNPVTVGQSVVGQTQVGAGNGPITSNHYEVNFHLGRLIDKFQNRQIKFVTTGIGYVSVSMHNDFDIRIHQEKLPRKYRNNP